MIRFIYAWEDRFFYRSISRSDRLGRWVFGKTSVAFGNVGYFLLRLAMRRHPGTSRSAEMSSLALSLALDRRD